MSERCDRERCGRCRRARRAAGENVGLPRHAIPMAPRDRRRNLARQLERRMWRSLGVEVDRPTIARSLEIDALDAELLALREALS